MATSPEIRPENFDLRDAILAHANELRTILGPKNELFIENTSEKYPVRMPGILLTTAVSNLASNARDAMPDGGTFSIRFTSLDLNEQEAESLEIWKGPNVLMTVQDNGVGISEAELKHIFEPFFTTKNSAAHPGLGLSTVYGIIKSSAGEIVCNSVLGSGTEFKIYLPLRS